MYNLIWRTLVAAASIAALSACTRRASPQALRVTPDLSGWRQGTLAVTRYMILGYLETRQRFLGRKADLSMCMPALLPREQDSLRVLLQKPNIRLECPEEPFAADTVERLHVESLTVDADSVIMRVVRIAPGSTHASWVESFVGPSDLLGGDITISALESASQSLSRDSVIPMTQDSLINTYLHIRRWIGIRPATETLCVESADTALNVRLQRLGRSAVNPMLRFAAACGRPPKVRNDIIDLELFRDRSTATSIAVRVHRVSALYPPFWFERFTLDPHGGWHLFLGGQPGID